MQWHRRDISIPSCKALCGAQVRALPDCSSAQARWHRVPPTRIVAIQHLAPRNLVVKTPSLLQQFISPPRSSDEPSTRGCAKQHVALPSGARHLHAPVLVWKGPTAPARGGSGHRGSACSCAGALGCWLRAVPTRNGLMLPSCLQAGSGAPITCCLREQESSNWRSRGTFGLLRWQETILVPQKPRKQSCQALMVACLPPAACLWANKLQIRPGKQQQVRPNNNN